MNRKLVKDVLFGAVAGVAGTFVIGKAMGLISRLQSNHDKWIERELVKEQPTQALAGKVAEGLGVQLSKKQKEKAGEVVHWGYGLFWGGVYGLLRNRYPATSKAAGLPFGVGLNVFGPGIMLPLMKLTPPPAEFPASSVARDLASHYAYAATVEGVCEALDAIDRAVSSDRPKLTNPELREVS